MNRIMVVLPLLCGSLWAQPWSGIIAPSRAIDWRNAGIPGGIPSGSWAQCGSTIAPYGTSASPGSTSTINTQISGCAANTYVQLGAGTFYLTGTITLKNQTEVRGMGANSTFLIFSGEGSCLGQYSQFCLAGSMNYPNGGEQNTATWTAGFSRGTTSITLSNSLNITANSTVIILDQQDDASDTGQVYNCTVTPCAPGLGGNSGSSRTDHTCSASVSPSVGYCSQQQMVLVTACSPSCNNSGSTTLTISPGLYMPNWRSSQSTGAWWPTTTAYQMGVQNLSADLTNTNAGTQTFVLFGCYQCWVTGVRSIYAARNHVWLWSTSHAIIQNNYFYQSTSHESQSYSVELYAGSSDNLIVNNICQQVTDSCPNNNGGGSGNVSAYNFSIDDIFESSGWFQPSDYDHAGGESFWLKEGNDGMGIIADQVHGTHQFTTAFRNRETGWQVAGCGNAGTGNPCNANTTAINLFASSRYFNVVGNVLGQANYHTQYTSVTTAGNQNASVFYIGGQQGGANGSFCTNAACSSRSTTVGDPLTYNSLMRWGNWDVVTAGCGHTLACSTSTVRWCGSSSDTGWSTTCSSTSEVGAAFGDATSTPSSYANLVPSLGDTGAGQTAMPASFVYGSKPSWFGNVPWPAVGPDVSGGNLGICSGGTYANSYATSSSQCAGGTLVVAFGGHANANPAMSCYLNVMGGPPDGTGNVLPFDADSCYGSGGSTGSISSATNLKATAH